MAADAEMLAALYEETGREGSGSEIVPCAHLLERLVTTLFCVLERRASVSLQVAVQEVSLPRDRRRALLLIASELLINALKYAFPTDRAGRIRVCLTLRETEAELIVEDDGVGLAPHRREGEGTRLVHALCALLEGRWERIDATDGGTACTVRCRVDEA